MRIAVIILCLCSLLLKGNTAMLTALQHKESNHAQFAHGHKSQHSHYKRASYNNASINDNTLSSEYVVEDVDEDDEHKNIAADKFRQMACSHATHAYPSYSNILNYLCKSFKATPSVCLPAMDLYISQGVLRI